MKHLFLIAVTFFITQEFSAQDNNYASIQDHKTLIAENDTESDWETVQIISDSSILEPLIQGEKLTVTYKVYGKDIDNISKAKNDAIIKLKKLAKERGYPTVALENIYSKTSGVPKRRYRIVKINAVGYKSKN